MAVHRTPAGTLALAIAMDVVLVLVFVLIGRGSHDESFSVPGTLTTLWPFLVGLAIGWLVTLAWRRPLGVLLPGCPIWIVTVLVGMLLRVLSGQGVQLTFVIVAAAVLGVFLVGWRALAAALRRIRSRRI